VAATRNRDEKRQGQIRIKDHDPREIRSQSVLDELREFCAKLGHEIASNLGIVPVGTPGTILL